MEKAAQPCHTCRRRRVKCDQSLPFCKKCDISRHECLGYQKLFLWNRGVASRGKMMGKTFPTAPISKAESPPAMHAILAGGTSVPQSTIATTSDTTMDSKSLRTAHFMALEKRSMYGSLHTGLNDPHFQCLSTVQRYYLYCFGTDINQSLVLYDMPGENPFQSLVQYAEHYELLRQIIIATAALYACRMYHSTDIESNHSPECSESSLEPGKQNYSGRALWHPLQDTYHDSLVAKLKALSLLAKAIQTGNVSSDIISTCVLLFVHFELIRPESTESRIHLIGAQALFRGLRPSKRAVQTVRNTVISDSILFDTMELALDTSRPWSSSITHSLLPLFERIGTSNHITYSLEMLHALTGACESLRQHSATATLDPVLMNQITSAIRRIAAIDARSWAESFHRIHLCTTCPGDIEIRIHLCEAHKAASIIFLARATGSTFILPIETYQDRLVEHLKQISYGQYLFKATSWPTFIAGLEAIDEGTASGLIDRLQFMCSILPYDFVRRALRMVKSVRLGAWENNTAQGDWTARLRTIIPTI